MEFSHEAALLYGDRFCIKPMTARFSKCSDLCRQADGLPDEMMGLARKMTPETQGNVRLSVDFPPC